MINKALKHIRQGTTIRVAFKSFIGDRKRKIISGYKQDLYNISRYGWTAPRFAERIWIDPNSCNTFLTADVITKVCGKVPRNASGLVLKSSWPFDQAMQITDHPKIKYAIDHWVNGTSWENTGAYEYMEKLIEHKNRVDGCENIDDIVRRYKELDLIFEQIKKEGRMKTRKEIVNSNFREMDGVLIHIGIDGKPLFGGGGCHRFVIAHILQIPIPSQIGCVHISAIPYLEEYRKG